MKPAVRIAAWGGVLAVLGLVFASYLSPHLVVDLANRVWACF
jgi:hypothetical protein